MQKILEFFKIPKVDSLAQLPKHSNFTYNYLIGIVMIYMTLSVLSGLTVYKIIMLGPFLLPVGIFTTPLTYCLSNVTTEVYGFPVSRNLMWWFVVSSTIFTCLAFTLINLPSPPDFKYQASYDLILGSMPIIYIAGIIGTIAGMNVNNYIVSKTKVIMEGKHYWLRSIISTCGGEVTYNLIAYPIMLWKMPFHSIIHIFISVTIFKMLTTVFFLLPECLLARYLKIKERLNVFDYNVNYNIFKFRVRDDNHRPRLKVIS